jgi:hypothetical protein
MLVKSIEVPDVEATAVAEVITDAPITGVPVMVGLEIVGPVPSTLAPEPVDVVTPVPPLATGSVPVTPVVKGNPVAFVNVPELGVPRTPPLTTAAPAEPTFTASAVATPVPSPDTPVETGRPVQFVRIPDVGVPSKGVVNVGDTKSALVAIATEMLTNSVLISVPLTILSGSPLVSASLVAKLVLCV